MREYIRHPSDIPIEYTVNDRANTQIQCLSNVSLGGLAFNSNEYIEPGKLITIKISMVTPAFAAHAKVVWCYSSETSAYEVGVEILDHEDAFRARMIEQVCHIEQYKKDIEMKEGRVLSGTEAASEWIALYAASFPKIEEVET